MKPGVAMEGRMLFEHAGTCVWCGQPTSEVAFAPGLGREVPMHPLPCGVEIVYAYRRVRNGIGQRTKLTAIRLARLTAPPAQLASGIRCRCAIGHTDRPCPWPAPKGRMRCPECVLVHRSKRRATA